NGVNPFGSRDANARVLEVDLTTRVPRLVPTGITEGASLASLACGPVLSPNEMSADGRMLPKLGKKMLSLRPLAKQRVAPDDSVPGPLSNARSLVPGSAAITAAPVSHAGLSTTYPAMIQAAFRPEWWQSEAIVTYDSAGTPTIHPPSATVRNAGRRK